MPLRLTRMGFDLSEFAKHAFDSANDRTCSITSEGSFIPKHIPSSRTEEAIASHDRFGKDVVFLFNILRRRLERIREAKFRKITNLPRVNMANHAGFCLPVLMY